MFWPAEVQFKVDRTGLGGATYCFVTDEAVTNAADLVLSYSLRDPSGQLTICDASYTYYNSWCSRNSSGSSIKLPISIGAGQFVLFGLSQYTYRSKPCVPGIDNCNFKLTVYEGACPPTCVAYTTWYGGGLTGTSTMPGGSGSATMVGNTSAAAASYNSYGGAKDQLWQVNVAAADTVTFSLCGGATWDTMMRLFDCSGAVIASSDDACSLQSQLTSLALSPLSSPYYLLVDGYGSANGAYTVTMSW
jgi:hypothetical protein